MDTHRLKYFLRIAEEGSITRAATLLGIAQPALSRQLALLEEDLGVALFRRNRRGVELTDAGERLRASTAAPLRQLELAVQYAGSPLARLERNLLIGIPELIVDILAVPLLRSLTSAFPNAMFAVTVGSTDQLVDAMLKGSIDVALINPVPDDRIFFREILSEEVGFAGGANSGLTLDRPVSFATAAGRPLVIPRSSSGIGTLLQNAALRAKVNLAYRVTTDSLAVAKALITAGDAYGFLPLSACQAEIADGTIGYAPIIDPNMRLTLGAAASAQLDLPRELATKIGDVIRAQAAALVTSGKWPAKLH